MQLHHDYTSEEFNMEFPRPGFKSIPKIDKISNDEDLTERSNFNTHIPTIDMKTLKLHIRFNKSITC